jgi:hypothetical protein
MSFLSDFTKPPEDVVIDLINFDNGTAFTPHTLLIVGDPLAIPKAPPAFRNTEILVRPTSATKKYGMARLWYNRILLSDVPRGRSIVFAIPPSARMVSDIVPLVNARYHINLTAKDYINASLPPIDELSRLISIQAAPTSLVYTGQLDLLVNLDGDEGLPIAEVVSNQYLDIFRFGREVVVPPPVPEVAAEPVSEVPSVELETA